MNMSNRIGSACIPALALMLMWTTAVAPAQYTRNPPRSVTGSVTDGSNEPIRGAVVQIEATDTLVIQSYVTDERGTYHFRELRSDVDYTLWAMFRGNKSKTHTLGKFDKQLDREIPIKIELDK